MVGKLITCEVAGGAFINLWQHGCIPFGYATVPSFRATQCDLLGPTGGRPVSRNGTLFVFVEEFSLATSDVSSQLANNRHPDVRDGRLEAGGPVTFEDCMRAVEQEQGQ